MENRHALKAQINKLNGLMRDFASQPVHAEMTALFAPDCSVQLAYPFEEMDGPTTFFEDALTPLSKAFPDLEKRPFITLADKSLGADWVGTAGHYVGTFTAPFLDIPPTGHMASMRFHEFYRFEAGKIVEVQALWDIPELMMHAGAWPLSPALGKSLMVTGPALQDGLSIQSDGAAHDARSVQIITDMLQALGNHKTGGPSAMELDKYWHPHFSWYGPEGIGSMRGISGFRNWHQIPFLQGMPDRGRYPDAPVYSLGEGDYVGLTGWPNMQMTLSDDGFLGIAPAGQKLTLRSLDFWRVENGLIRENWVLVDLLSAYAQLGVDVLARMRALTSANPFGPNRSYFETEIT